MKRYLFGIVALALATAGSAQATGNHTMNIRVNPLGLALGVLGADLDFAVSDSATIGPSIGFASATSTTTIGTSSTSTKTTATQIGARANFFLGHKRFTDGWYLAPLVGFTSASSGSASASAIQIAALAGHGWFWNGGFNMAVGAGLQYIALDSSVYAISGVLPALEFTLGYSF